MIVGITGASGFIGQSLVKRYLDNGDTVRVLLRNSKSDFTFTDPVQIHTCDLVTCNSDELVPFVDGLDVLYHCAAELINEDRMQGLHIKGTEKLIFTAKNRIGRWVQLSSVGVYGSYDDGTVREENPVNPQGVYERTKAESDNLVQKYANQKAFKLTIIRPSNVYGTLMKSQWLFQLISYINRGLFIYFGKENSCFNLIHVDDVVEALWLCAKQNQDNNEIFIISNNIRILDFVDIISEILGRKPVIVKVPAFPVYLVARSLGWLPGSPITISRYRALTNSTIYSSDKIRNNLGFYENNSLVKNMENLVQYWKDKQ